jgi:hypothetical protein
MKLRPRLGPTNSLVYNRPVFYLADFLEIFMNSTFVDQIRFIFRMCLFYLLSVIKQFESF